MEAGDELAGLALRRSVRDGDWKSRLARNDQEVISAYPI
jgi:hypothetical protein